MNSLELVGWLSHDGKNWRPCGDCLHFGYEPETNSIRRCSNCIRVPPDVLVKRDGSWTSQYKPEIHGVLN